MSLAADVALGAAERVRRNLGPRAGLLSYRALATNAAESETRGRATLAGLSCAIELGDEEAATAMVGLYTSVIDGPFEDEVRRLALAMLRRGATGSATEGWVLAAAGLAALESVRSPRAGTAYLHARCLERASDRSAAEVFLVAEERATREGADEIVQNARARRVALLHDAGAREEAFALEKSLTVRAVSPEVRLRLARYGLTADSRFARAGWLGELEELGKSRDARTRELALELACAHADRMGLSLTSLEEDRLLALFGKLPDQATGARLAARLCAFRPLAEAARSEDGEALLRAIGAATVEADPATACVRRAVDVARGRFEAKVDLSRLDAAHLAITACAALRDEDLPRAEAALSKLETELGPAPPASRAPAWEAAYLGLHADSEPARRAALAVVARLLRLDVPLPPRGGVALARACREFGEAESAELLRLATRARESGAEEAYFERTRELGWRAALAGRRDEALRLLGEAKRVAK